MRDLFSLSTRRLVAVATAVVLVATAGVAGVAFAGSGGHRHKSPPSAGSTRAPDSVARAALAALEGLVANGTIDRAQATIIERQVRSGQVDPNALVAAGTVTAAQMHAVANALTLVKLAAAHATGGSRVGVKSPAPKAVTGAPAAVVRAARTALDRLVANGTIDREQAGAIQRRVAAGSLDPAALVAAGTLTQSQMGAVMAVLQHVKGSAVASRQ